MQTIPLLSLQAKAYIVFSPQRNTDSSAILNVEF